MRGLDKMFTWKRTRCLRTLIHSATWSQGRKELLLSLSGPLAVDVVEIMQEVRTRSWFAKRCSLTITTS